jgi:hypothetical protein
MISKQTNKKYNEKYNKRFQDNEVSTLLKKISLLIFIYVYATSQARQSAVGAFIKAIFLLIYGY